MSLTMEEIEEGNELIANFVGLLKTNVESVYGTIDNDKLIIDIPCSVPFTEELYFHNSWDWLMPVVEKIDSMPEIFTRIHLNSCFITPTNDSTKYIAKVHGKTKIEATFKAVVEFIKWYNANK